MSNTTHRKFRIFHRYLGFFLAGIMAIYAISGVVLIFRKTDTFKKDKTVTQELPKGIPTEKLGDELKIKNFEISNTEGQTIYFNGGSFDRATGIATYTKKELPFVLDKLTHLHKATTNDPLYFLNMFFGFSLLFFVVSSFWMFLPKSEEFKKAVYFYLAGALLVILMLFVG
jgi:hypothetical protein